MSALGMYDECKTCLCGQKCATRGNGCNPCIDCNGKPDPKPYKESDNDYCFYVPMDSECPLLAYGEKLFKIKEIKP